MVYDPNFDPDAEVPPPTPEMMAEMGAFIGEAVQAGVLVATGALQPKGTTPPPFQREIHRDRWAVHRADGAARGLCCNSGAVVGRGYVSQGAR